MSSSAKTANIGLNQWAGSDCPKRADFNADNALTDAAINDHANDADCHITAGEREKWNAGGIITGAYTGNGASSRLITLDTPAGYVRVFREGFPVISAGDGGIVCNAAECVNGGGFSTAGGISSSGISLACDTIVLEPYEGQGVSYDFNADGVAYCYIAAVV